VRLCPFHKTVVPRVKLSPVIAIVAWLEPTTMACGETALTLGAPGAEIAKLAVAWPPPGDGLVTTTLTVPVAPKSVDSTSTLSCAEFTKVVSLGDLFQDTFELLTKLDPFTVRVKPSVPAAAEEGVIDTMEGSGF
jgi:hypothetical protein